MRAYESIYTVDSILRAKEGVHVIERILRILHASSKLFSLHVLEGVRDVKLSSM